jgi:hypothetical protein
VRHLTNRVRRLEDARRAAADDLGAPLDGLDGVRAWLAAGMPGLAPETPGPLRGVLATVLAHRLGRAVATAADCEQRAALPGYEGFADQLRAGAGRSRAEAAVLLGRLEALGITEAGRRAAVDGEERS